MEWIRISSRQNALVKRLFALADKKARDREKLFLCEGITLLRDAASAGVKPEIVAVSAFAEKKLVPVAEKLFEGKEGIKGILCDDFVFEKVTDQKSSEGIVAAYSDAVLPCAIPLSDSGFLLALERIQDPGNFGTVIRTAASLGAAGILTTGCADARGSKAVRASMGALFRIPIRDFSDTANMLDYLKKNNIRSVAACLSGSPQDIRTVDFSGKVCVMIGNEGNGLSAEAMEKADMQAVIPIERMESLNASAAAAIFLWEMKRAASRNERA